MVIGFIQHFSNSSHWLNEHRENTAVLTLFLASRLVGVGAGTRSSSRSHLNVCLSLLQFVMIRKLYLLFSLHSSEHHPSHTPVIL